MPTQQPLLAAIARILRPLVRLLLRHGVPYQVFSELARWIYMDVAARDFEISGRKQTQSRISVLTGLSRKEVLRLQNLSPPTEDAAVGKYHRAARIVSAWVREPRFHGEDGDPRPLPMEGANSFSSLVAGYGGDVPPRAVLDELLRVGTIDRDPSGTVRLRTRAYLPAGASGDEEGYAILGTDVTALIETIDHNLRAPPGKRFFQRKVAYTGVPADVVPTVRSLAAREGQHLLEAIDRTLAARLNAKTGQPAQNVLLGVYWHQGDEDPAAGGRPARPEESTA